MEFSAEKFDSTPKKFGGTPEKGDKLARSGSFGNKALME
jgi:hypothetical protein